MGVALISILSLITLAMLVYAIYLLARVGGVYRHLKGLNVQRDYETMLYAALPKAGVDDLVELIPPDSRDDLMAEVLERIGSREEGELQQKVSDLYQRLGFYERRLQQTEKGRSKKREKAREKLASMGLPTSREKLGGSEEEEA